MAEKTGNAVSKPNIVLVGSKPVMNYVVACVTFFNQGVNNIVLKARGKAISKTICTVELLKRAFVKDLVVQKINIGTELVERENRKSNVSTIEISIEKPPL